MNAQAALQRRIDAQQDVDAIDYGLRSIRACGGWRYCVGVHAAQLRRASEVAGRVLGEAVVVGCVGDFSGAPGRYYSARQGGRTKEQLARALKAARAELKAAQADLKDYGSKRQLRLALAAGGDEIALVA